MTAGPELVPRTASDGEPLDRLTARCYAELLVIARRERRRTADVATLDTRAVLHEAFLRLADQRQVRWEDRTRFLAAAAGTMRRVLLDHVRRRRAAKRRAEWRPLTLDDAVGGVALPDEELLALDEALVQLAAWAPRLAQVVECRYFAGMTEAEIAAALDVAERTVRRDWVKARGWLRAVLDAS
jgi:RNA polymerase sigma factor (TIGR02999 family)